MRKIYILASIVLITILCLTVVSQANSFVFDTSASPTTLNPGDEITISLGVSSIDIGENGINTVEANMKYDTNVFEKVKSSDITSLNNWSITFNDEEGSANGKLLAVNVTEGVKENQKIGTIKLKVKSDVKVKTTKIQFTNVQTNDGTDIINESDKAIDININIVEKDTNNTINNTTNNATNNSTNNNTANTTNNTSNKTTNNTQGTLGKNTASNNSTPQKLPKTGVVQGGIIAIIILGIVAIVSFIRYKNAIR